VLVAVLAADECLIDFDDAAQLVHVALNKRSANAVTHIPRSFVGAEAHLPHQLERGNTFLAGQHLVRDLKPLPKWLVGVLEYRPGNTGKPIAVCSADFALPMEAGCQRIDLGIATAGAFDALRPAARDQVSAAGVLIGESRSNCGTVI
jgi:hypothetical protein